MATETSGKEVKALLQSAAPRSGYWFLLALLALLIVISALPVSAQSAEVIMPQPTGSYAVGRTIYEWTDSSRAERYSDDPDAKRELSV